MIIMNNDKHIAELKRNDAVFKSRQDHIFAILDEMYQEIQKIKQFIKYVPPENPTVVPKGTPIRKSGETITDNIGFTTQGGKRMKVINN
jgi:hypothetical protein